MLSAAIGANRSVVVPKMRHEVLSRNAEDWQAKLSKKNSQAARPGDFAGAKKSARRCIVPPKLNRTAQRTGRPNPTQGVATMTKRMKRLVLAAILAGGVAAPRLVSAHHSSSSYDMEHPVSVKGVVKNMEWTNPHVFIFVDVKDESGSVEEWRVEGNSPNMLTRVGWRKEMINPGDTLQVNGAPAKNGAKVMRLINLTLATGQKLDGQGFK
jgi:uncharacterized protein DUF6152